jgi:hypothetical protein
VLRSIAHALGAGLLGVAAIAATAIAENEARGVVRSTFRDGTVVVEAKDASILEIVESLSQALDFEVEGEAPSKDVRVSRSLEGTLNEVLEKLLNGANYVLVTEAGAPKRLLILTAGPTPARASPTSPHTAAYASMSVEQLRQKQDEFLNLVTQYEDMSEEARERIKPGLARKYRDEARKYSREAAAIRTLLPP